MSISVCLFFENHYFLCFTIIKPSDSWEDWPRQQFSFRFHLNPDPHRVLSFMPSDGSNLLSFYHPFFKSCFFFLFPTWLLRNWPHICPFFLSPWSSDPYPPCFPMTDLHLQGSLSCPYITWFTFIMYLKEQGGSAVAHLEPQRSGSLGRRTVSSSLPRATQPALVSKTSNPTTLSPKRKIKATRRKNRDKEKKWRFSSSDYFPIVKGKEWNILVGWEGRLSHWSRGSKFYFLRETEEQKLETVESPHTQPNQFYLTLFNNVHDSKWHKQADKGSELSYKILAK